MSRELLADLDRRTHALRLDVSRLRVSLETLETELQRVQRLADAMRARQAEFERAQLPAEPNPAPAPRSHRAPYANERRQPAPWEASEYTDELTRRKL